MVDLLISKGADVMIRDKDGVTPLMSAASQVRCPSLNPSWQLLSQHYTAPVASFSGGTSRPRNPPSSESVLTDAMGSICESLQGHKEVSELLITKNADVNAVASSGYVPSPCTSAPLLPFPSATHSSGSLFLFS